MELDVSKKVRTAIKAKLLELGCHVDEELPDYIMILIANRRSKEQMEEDLGLFLSDNTLKFTSWLHQVLKKLQEVTTAGPMAKPPINTVAAVSKPEEELPRPVEKIVESKAVIVKTAPVPPEPKINSNIKRRKIEVEPLKETQVEEEEEPDLQSPESKKLKISRQAVTSPKAEIAKLSLVDQEEPPERIPVKSRLESRITKVETPKVQSCVKVASVLSKVSRSKSPVSAPNSRRSPIRPDRSPLRKRSRSPISLSTRKHSFQRDRSVSPRDGFRKSRLSSRLNRGSKSRSRSGSPTTKARKSLRSLVAVVRRHNELNALKDEEYNPSRPQVTSTSVASVVHVTPRPKRATKQQSGGSNKLLFRALADAQKSIASHAVSSKVPSGGDKDKSETDSVKADSRKRSSSESSELKQKNDEGMTAKKAEVKTQKPSVKDRLGFRLGNRVPVRQRLDLKAEEYAEEYVPGRDDNYKSIIINVPTSKDAKERCVTLEDESKRLLSLASQEEPKRLSIQVNVDSDDTSSSEDELEIQPRPSEDLNLEPQDDTQKSNDNSVSSKKTKKSESDSDSESEEAGRSSTKTRSGKSSPDEEDSTTKDMDESSKHSEELEIEEYEEIEEEEDDEEYEVVLQEKNIALPDPGEYDSVRKDKIDMEIENETSSAMDVTDNKDYSDTGIEMDDSVGSENVRYPLNLRSFNRGDTKFVVTMDGSEDNYYSNEESMETEAAPMQGIGADLRQRIGRSVKVNPGMSQPAMPIFTAAKPYLPITGRPFTAQAAPAAAPSCKYWPECSFKDKCIYPHPKCKFGESCTKPQCPYKHDTDGGFGNSAPTEGLSTKKNSESGGDGKVLCKFFPKCHSMSCQFFHPSPCRFGIGCTDAKCKNFHPGQTVGQQRSQNKIYGAVSRPKAYRAPPPAAHLLRWKAPSAILGGLENKKEEEVEVGAASSVDTTTSSTT